jgi:hypothetical protein
MDHNGIIINIPLTEIIEIINRLIFTICFQTTEHNAIGVHNGPKEFFNFSINVIDANNCSIENCSIENCSIENCSIENCSIENCSIEIVNKQFCVNYNTFDELIQYLNGPLTVENKEYFERKIVSGQISQTFRDSIKNNHVKHLLTLLSIPGQNVGKAYLTCNALIVSMVQNHITYETTPKSYQRVFIQTLINVLYDTICYQKSKMGIHGPAMVSDHAWRLRLLLKYTKLVASNPLMTDNMVTHSHIQNRYRIDGDSDENSVYAQCELIASGVIMPSSAGWAPRQNKNSSIFDVVESLKRDCVNSLKTIDSEGLGGMSITQIINLKIANIQMIQECDCIIQAQMRANAHRRISTLMLLQSVRFARLQGAFTSKKKSAMCVFLNAATVRSDIKRMIAKFL